MDVFATPKFREVHGESLSCMSSIELLFSLNNFSWVKLLRKAWKSDLGYYFSSCLRRRFFKTHLSSVQIFQLWKFPYKISLSYWISILASSVPSLTTQVRKYSNLSISWSDLSLIKNISCVTSTSCYSESCNCYDFLSIQISLRFKRVSLKNTTFKILDLGPMRHENDCYDGEIFFVIGVANNLCNS